MLSPIKIITDLAYFMPHLPYIQFRLRPLILKMSSVSGYPNLMRRLMKTISEVTICVPALNQLGSSLSLSLSDLACISTQIEDNKRSLRKEFPSQMH